jgi:DNA polymerase-3 subunit epsilon
MTIDISQFVFIDFEACSLDPRSWPIEVGTVRLVDGQSPSSWSSLIKPHRTWQVDLWSPQSETVHGISRNDLEDAPKPEDVADVFMSLCAGMTLVSDAPEWDRKWGRALVGTVGRDMPAIVDFEAVVSAICDGDFSAINAVYKTLDDIRAPHRARKDAERLACAVLSGLAARGA